MKITQVKELTNKELETLLKECYFINSAEKPARCNKSQVLKSLLNDYHKQEFFMDKFLDIYTRVRSEVIYRLVKDKW